MSNTNDPTFPHSVELELDVSLWEKHPAGRQRVVILGAMNTARAQGLLDNYSYEAFLDFIHSGIAFFRRLYKLTPNNDRSTELKRGRRTFESLEACSGLSRYKELSREGAIQLLSECDAYNTREANPPTFWEIRKQRELEPTRFESKMMERTGLTLEGVREKKRQWNRPQESALICIGQSPPRAIQPLSEYDAYNTREANPPTFWEIGKQNEMEPTRLESKMMKRTGMTLERVQEKKRQWNRPQKSVPIDIEQPPPPTKGTGFEIDVVNLSSPDTTVPGPHSTPGIRDSPHGDRESVLAASGTVAGRISELVEHSFAAENPALNPQKRQERVELFRQQLQMKADRDMAAHSDSGSVGDLAPNLKSKEISRSELMTLSWIEKVARRFEQKL